jgi:cysteine-rich repeat protein
MKRSRAIPGPIGLILTCAAAVAVTLAAAAMGSCIDDGTMLCVTSGLRCPEGLACTKDGTGCTDSACGNGITEGDEACDDGNVRGNDLCNKDCTSDGRCGNGIVDTPNEDCEPGMIGGVPCDSQCRRQCGNQQLDPGEECDQSLLDVTCVDLGFDRGTAGCDVNACVALQSECAHIGWHRDVRMAEGTSPVAIGDLRGVWGADNGQIFAVGTDASGEVVMILRFNGQSWSIDKQGPNQGTLLDIWGSGFQDVFAVGEGGRALYRGQSGGWLPLNTRLGAQITLRGVWGDGKDGDVIAVGDAATIVRFVRGSGQWLPEIPSDVSPDTVFEAVWGRDGSEMWAVGHGGVIMRYAERDWVREAEGLTGADLFDVWGSEDGDVFAVGADGTILRRYQNEWTIMSAPQQDDLYTLWGSGRDSVFAAGERGVTLFYDGQSWRALAAGTDLDLIDMSRVPGYGLVGVAPNGFILRLDGWSWMPLPAPAASDSLRSLWARELDEVYGVFDSHPYLRRFDGDAWQAVDIDHLLPPVSGGPGPLRSLWGRPEGDLYVVGDDKLVLRFHPASGWERMDLPADIPASHLHRAWSSSDGHLFVVGELDGQSDGIILRHDRVSWRRMSKNRQTVLHGIWGVSKNEVFAVGTGGVILRYDGNAEDNFGLMDSGTQADLNAIWGNTRGNIHVVGDNGVALAYNGITWKLDTDLTAEHLYDVWGSGVDHVFAVGSGGALLHRTGPKWAVVSSGTDQPLTSISGVDGPRRHHRVVIFGGEGAAFRRFLVNDDANSEF